MVEQYTDHLNVEIQQRACEFVHLYEKDWDSERMGLFEPMPFKGDENMTVDVKGRAILDEEEGEGQLFLMIDPSQKAQASHKEKTKQPKA